ncbi:MAG: PBP1A family penicillin-binding protein [Pacificimonas sp.]|jgi:penicillin-binding protein 1A|nr:PBP1A family penicillin-binding protein [Pacificimonas sp.]
MFDFLRRRSGSDTPLNEAPLQEAAPVIPDYADSAFAAEEAAGQGRDRRRRWFVRGLGAAVLAMILLFGVLAWTAPLGKALEPLDEPAIVLEAANGTPIARRGQYKAEPVDINALPPHVYNAFIAIEDQRFFSHWGLDPRGIGRALGANVREGAVVQGGSTITQQLAKTAFLSSERSLWRKAQEAVIALWLELWLTKEEILERYLSSVYFGEGAWGLGAASQTYFSKVPGELTLGESAMLAGLMKAPSRLAPTQNYAGARERGKLVIAAMKEQGLITDAEWSAARKAEMNPGRDNLPVGSYFADWISPVAKNMVRAGYGETRIRTTLDFDMQQTAQRILQRRLARSSATQGALIAMRPDGRVLAMVGGTDYRASAFNRAVQAKRQSGSAFKLFVYLTALRSGMNPNSMVEDAPVTLGNWQPSNYDDSYAGPITLESAFARSSNVAAARLADRVGVEAMTDAARDLGVDSELGDDLTIALGSSSTTLLEMTAAYAAVAAGRYPIEPYGIEEQEDGSLGARLERALGGEQRTLREQRDLLQLLNAVMERGTARRINLAINDYGKTGTTQDNRDALFIGFVPGLVVGVWVGNDDNSPTNGVTGSNVPADIWREFVLAASPEARSAEERARRIAAAAEERERAEAAAEAERQRGGDLIADIEDLIAGDEMAGRRILERVLRGELTADGASAEIEREIDRRADEAPERRDQLDDFEDQWREALKAYEELAREPAPN